MKLVLQIEMGLNGENLHWIDKRNMKIEYSLMAVEERFKTLQKKKLMLGHLNKFLEMSCAENFQHLPHWIWVNNPK